MKEKMYRQVKLTCDEKHIVTHIPDHAAVVGTSMRIAPFGQKDLSDDRWTVAEVYDKAVPLSEMRELAHRHKH